MNKRFATLAAIRRSAGVAAGSLALVGSQAMAEVPAAVTTELGTAKTDVMAVGALVFAVAVGVVIFKWFRRAL